MLALFLLAIPASGIDLQIGPSIGLVLPGELEDAPTYPGPGLYYGGVGEYAFSGLLSMELSVGGSIGLGEPWDQGFHSYSGETADLLIGSASITANPAALSLSAGMGYYYIHMDWEQWNDDSIATYEWKSLEVHQLGYSLALGLNVLENADFRVTLHFPEMKNLWGVISINWKPLDI
jgi:hypothetical protein